MNIKKIVLELARSLTDTTRSLETIANSEKILKQAYEGRFLFELIQNARDANKEVENEKGKVKIELNENELIILNSGAPFSEKGIKSISTIGASPKDNKKYIGHKGIGFKSVLEISDTPKIETEFGTIFFDRKVTFQKLQEKGKEIELKKTPLFFFPHYSPKKLQNNNYTTKIILPLKKDTNLKEKIKVAFDEIGIEQLVLLGNLKEIVFNYHSVETRYLISPANKSNTIKIEKFINNEIEETNYFKLFFKKVKVDKSIVEQLSNDEKELYKIDDDLEIKVLIKTDNRNRFISIDKSKLYLFYPLKINSGFPFLIHSNFIVNPERTQLSNSFLNQFLLKEIGKYVSNDLLVLIKKSYQTNLLSLLRFEIIDDIEILYETVIENLKNKKIIFDKETKKFYKPNEIIIGNLNSYKIFENKTFLNKRIIQIKEIEKEWLTTNFGCDILSDNLLLTQIENECRIQKRKNNYTFFENLYKYISLHNLDVSDNKLFLTTTKKLVSQNETVFYGGRKEEILKELPNSIKNKIYFIHSKIDIKNFSENYNHKSIKKFSIRDFVKKLLSVYDTKGNYNWDILKVLIKIDYSENKSVIDELYQKVKFPIVNSNKWVKSNEVIYTNNNLLKELYPNSNILDEVKVKKSLKITKKLSDFYFYCGVWDIPSIIINDTYLDYNDSRNNLLSNFSGLSSYPFSIYNDRFIEEPSIINNEFTKIILKNINRYVNYVNNSDLPKFRYKSYSSEKKNVHQKITKYTSFVFWLKNKKWVSIKNLFYKPSEVLGINPLDYSKQHNKILLDFLPILEIEWNNNDEFYTELGIKHFDNYNLNNYQNILSFVYQNYKDSITKNLKSFYNKILSKLSDLYDYNSSQRLDVNWFLLNDTYFLAYDSFKNEFVWEKAKNIYHIDNLQLFKQLPLDIQKKLQPSFTNRDKNTFGRIASKIGRLTSKSIKYNIKKQKAIFTKSIFEFSENLAEILTLLEHRIQRSLNQNELNLIKNSSFIFQNEVVVNYIIDENEEGISKTTSHFIRSNQVYLNKESEITMKHIIFNDLFSSILERDLKSFDIDKLIEDYLLSENKNEFIKRYEISEERISEINGLLKDFILSKKQEFWLTILKLNEDFVFSHSIIEDNILVNKIIEDYKISKEDENDIEGLISKIDYVSLNSESNINLINNLFTKLSINISDFNKLFLYEINFRGIHIKNMKRLFNKYEVKFISLIYSFLFNKKIELKSEFQSIIDSYTFLANNIKIKSGILKIDYDTFFIDLINEEFDKYLKINLNDLDKVKIEKTTSLYKTELTKLEQHFKTQNINFDVISSNSKLRSLLYFDYELLLQYSDEFIIKKNQLNTKTDNKENLQEVTPLISATPEYIEDIININKPKRNKNGNRVDGSSGTETKQSNGLLAEKKVFTELSKMSFSNLKWVSKNASKVEKGFIGFNPEGDDSLGYDMEYLDENNNKIFIEVKSRSNNDFSFPISAKEKEFAMKNSKYYKVIFVSNLKHSPLIIDLGLMFNFSKNETFEKNSKFTRILNDYIIKFKIS
jgi:hypothetical protein